MDIPSIVKTFFYMTKKKMDIFIEFLERYLYNMHVPVVSFSLNTGLYNNISVIFWFAIFFFFGVENWIIW